MGTIRRRKENWTGHILREGCLQKLVIEGKAAGKKEKNKTRKV